MYNVCIASFFKEKVTLMLKILHYRNQALIWKGGVYPGWWQHPGDLKKKISPDGSDYYWNGRQPENLRLKA